MQNRRLFVLLTLVLFWSSFAIAQDKPHIDPVAFFDENKRWYNGFTEAWFQFFDIPEAEVRKSIEHWELIGRDLNQSQTSPSGTYASGGSTHGSYVRWSQRSGFVWLDVDKCQGGPMRILRGRVEAIPEGVAFIPEVALGRSRGHAQHTKHADKQDRMLLVTVSWLGMTYLVPKESLSDFSNYAAGLGEYNGNFIYMFDAPFLSKMADESESVVSKYRSPVYPAGYETYLKRPIRGAIVAIGKGTRRVDQDSDTSDTLVTPLKIKLENTENLKAGLNLHAVGEKAGFTESFELRSYDGDVATVEHVRLIPKKNCVVSEYDDCSEPVHLRLRLGLVLSSNGL